MKYDDYYLKEMRKGLEAALTRALIYREAAHNIRMSSERMERFLKMSQHAFRDAVEIDDWIQKREKEIADDVT
jgi:hypothetical protein